MGLFYRMFDLSDFTIAASGTAIRVDVTNTGSQAGAAVCLGVRESRRSHRPS